MNTCVALVGAYLRFNGYVTVPEQPVLIGQGKPYRYHTATDIDILAVRFPNAAVVVPRDYGTVEDDLLLDVDCELDLHDETVDVLIGEVKSGRPRLNEGLRDPDVLYATLRRVDPGFDAPLHETIQALIRHGEAQCKSAGKKWRFRLVAFGEGQPAPEGGPYTVIQMRHVAAFLVRMMREHHQVWKDAQFGDPVLDMLHLFDKMGFTWRLADKDENGNPTSTDPNKPAEQMRRKPKQNEKVPHPEKPRVKTAAVKNGNGNSARKNGTKQDPPKKAASPQRTRTVSNEGWIPGGG